MPYGADQLWDALALAPEAAAAKLHGFGRRLGRVLLDESALRTVAALVDSPGSLDVVVETEGLGLALPSELIRLADDRVLATIPSVRFTRRLTGVWRAPTPPSPGPLALLAEVTPAERELFVELGTGADGTPA